jgi:hypothetical protein
MARRRPMSRKSSRREFKRGVNRQHPKNRMDSYFMRGGIRL